MAINAITPNKNIYNYYLNKEQNINRNIVSFKARYKLGKDFELLNKKNIDKACDLYYGYRANAGQKNISVEKTKKFLETKLNNPEHKMLLLKKGNEYIGFLMFSKTVSTIDIEPILVMDALFISPENRGKHYSTKLINKIKEIAELNNYKGIRVKTWANNASSNGLYNSCSFSNETLNWTTYFWANQNILNCKNEKYMSDKIL